MSDYFYSISYLVEVCMDPSEYYSYEEGAEWNDAIANEENQ